MKWDLASPGGQGFALKKKKTLSTINAVLGQAEDVFWIKTTCLSTLIFLHVIFFCYKIHRTMFAYLSTHTDTREQD